MAIRQPPSDIKDPNLRGFLQELRNAIGGVTAQVSTLARSIQVINGGGTTPTTPTNPTDPTNPTNPTPGGDGYPPPPPLSLTATADVWAINLAWENPVIADYLGTEIWAKRTFPTWSSSTRYYVNAKVLYSGVVYRAKKGNDATGGAAVDNTNHVPTDTTWWEATTLTVMADRVLVTEVAGSSYTFTGLTSELLTPGETWAFWVRNHDIENLFSTYFPDNDQGVSATTLLDPGAMIDLLTGAIKETELYKDLGDRIDLIDVDIPGRQSLVTITTELDNGLTTTNGIVAKKVATFRQGTQPTSTSTYTLVAGDIWINTADQNKAYRYNGSGWDRIDNTQIDATAASVLNKEEAKIGYCSISPNTYLTKATCVAAGGNWIDQPFATKVTQVGVTASDGTTATVQQQMESIYGPGGLRSQYTVKIDNNGYVSGFGLASTPVNGTPYSDFIIRVDRFSIAQPASPDAGYQSDATIPFIVTTGSTTINGETVPAGTYIKDAYIQNGTITSAKIGNAAITNAKVGNTIYSSDFNGDPNYPVSAWSSSGWAINKNGQACFNNVRVRGDVLLGSTNVVSNNPGAYGTPNEWTAFYNTTAGVFYSAPTLGLEYSYPSGGANLRLYYAANSTAPSTDPWSQALVRRPGTTSDYTPVVGGRSYQFSAWTGAVNCIATLFAYIYDANFNNIGVVQSATNASERSGGTTLNEANWKVLSITGALGSAAAYVRLVLHRWGPTDRTQVSYARFTRPFFSEVPADYAYVIPWSPGGISLLDTLGLRENAATIHRVAKQSYGFSLSNNSSTYTAIPGLSITVPITAESVTQQLLISGYAKIQVGQDDPMRANARVAYNYSGAWYYIKYEALTKIPSSSVSGGTEYAFSTSDIFDIAYLYNSGYTSVQFRLEVRMEAASASRTVSDGTLSILQLKR